MGKNKTQATSNGTSDYIAAIADESRRSDCQSLLELMARASKHPAVMWGSAIVGFGIYGYLLAGGKRGEICAVGFSSRKADISIYGVTGTAGAGDLLTRLGRHRLGKGCLYVSSLADIDLKILERLVSRAVKAKQA
jgi:Domain of unknown function (DU1801)